MKNPGVVKKADTAGGSQVFQVANLRDDHNRIHRLYQYPFATDD
jgi:hypothetical protein